MSDKTLNTKRVIQLEMKRILNPFIYLPGYFEIHNFLWLLREFVFLFWVGISNEELSHKVLLPRDAMFSVMRENKDPKVTQWLQFKRNSYLGRVAGPDQ